MSKSLEASLVRIRTADGLVVGAGFLVGERYILTCAHVVSQVLGLSGTAIDLPQAAVSLDFPRIPPHTLFTARVVQWCPPLSNGSGDIAGLELVSEPPSGAEMVRFAEASDVWKHDFSAFGFPTGYDDGVWTTGRLLRRQATNWIQIEDVKAQGFAVAPGFSGAPVWDEQLQGVVGMVVAASRPTDTRTAFVIPLDVLVAAWPQLTLPKGEPRNPYKGLRPFKQDDTGDFFGREQVVDKLVETVAQMVTEQPTTPSKRLLTILGPSGSGKSSLVMAGILPRLQQGALPGSEVWIYLEPMVPGKHPLEALILSLAPYFPDRSFTSLREDLEDKEARGLHQLAAHLLTTRKVKQPGAKVVLLVDQFEELFTQTESEEERERFIHLLLVACSELNGALLGLLTLRADFYDRPMGYPVLYQMIEAHQVALLSMDANDLRRVIEQPVTLPDVQLTFEGDLVGDLLFELQGQVGALPLLQFTLDQLFQKRNGRHLTLSAYRELGGVKGALTRQAEETYAAFPSDEHRKLARALFLRLIDPGSTEQDTTRRRAGLSEFTLDDPAQTRLMQETIDAFIAARLLTTNEVAGKTTIEVSHEAVIREWKRLADWLREARQDIPLQQAISEDAAEWERHGKPADRLYRGSQLKEAQAWARRSTLSGNEVAFLRAGAAHRRRYVVSVAGIVLLLLSTIGVAGLLTDRLLSLPNPTYVTTLNDAGPGSLRYAVDAAAAGSTITFNASLHGIILLSSGDLDFAKNLTIRGPGAGILSISSGKRSSIIRVLSGTTVAMSGLTFKDSKTSEGYLKNEGRLTLASSIISGNTATSYGGGIFNSGTLTMNNSIVSGNTATGPSSSGGIFNSGTLTMNNSIVSGNTVANPYSGGGISNSGTLTMNNSTVSGNTATGGASSGGGIFNSGGKLTMNNSTVSGNTADNPYSGGGGIFNQGGKLTMNNSTVSGNTATSPSSGGGIYNGGGKLTMNNSTVSGNTATSGGGIVISDHIINLLGTYTLQATLLYCTVYGNSANIVGGILIDTLDKKNQVSIGASIVAGNKAHTGLDIEGPLTTLGYNLIGDGSGARFLGWPKVHPIDMLEVPLTKLGIDHVLRDNGGSVRPHTWTHALLPGSPAIDLIPPEVCLSFKVESDQRSVKRPQGKGCDSGAYEYVPSP